MPELLEGSCKITISKYMQHQSHVIIQSWNGIRERIIQFMRWQCAQVACSSILVKIYEGILTDKRTACNHCDERMGQPGFYGISKVLRVISVYLGYSASVVFATRGSFFLVTPSRPLQY